MEPEQYHSDEAPFAHRVLIGLIPGVCHYHRLVLTAAFLLAAISACAIYTCLEYHTRRNDLINPNKDYQQRWQQYISEFGDDEDIVVVVQGSDRERMREAL